MDKAGRTNCPSVEDGEAFRRFRNKCPNVCHGDSLGRSQHGVILTASTSKFGQACNYDIADAVIVNSISLLVDRKIRLR